ncbi:MAG: FBP domain-containing protein [Actinobacteria bacterium]|nr:FBP domain-containing protein [Actinomycetota bacterium]
MRALTEDQIRASFRNAESDEVVQIGMPHDLLLAEWDYLDFFAWRDPIASKNGYIVIERDGEAVGIVLRAADPSRARNGMCNLCHTMQPGNQVALFAARRAGEEGRRGATVGTYICVDLSCHESVRLAPPLAPNEVRAESHADRRLDGTHRRVYAFVETVLGGA